LFSLVGSPLGQYVLQRYFKGLLLTAGNEKFLMSPSAAFHYSLLPVEVFVRMLKPSGYSVIRRREERRGKM